MKKTVEAEWREKAVYDSAVLTPPADKESLFRSGGKLLLSHIAISLLLALMDKNCCRYLSLSSFIFPWEWKAEYHFENTIVLDLLKMMTSSFMRLVLA